MSLENAVRVVSTDEKGNQASSTKLIELLHSRVDALTTTNIELTTKLQELLGNLDTVQQRERKLKESAASLRHEGDNVTLMLNRKERKLTEVKEAIVELTTKLGEAKEVNHSLKQKFEDEGLTSEESLRESISEVKTEYDTLVKSHEIYESSNDIQCKSLEDRFSQALLIHGENMKALDGTAEQILANNSELVSQLRATENKAESARTSIRNASIDTAAKVDLEKWLFLYKEAQRICEEFASKTDTKLPDELQAIIDDPVLKELDARFALDEIQYGKTRNKRIPSNPLLSNSQAAARRVASSSANYSPRVSSAQGSLPGITRTPSMKVNNKFSDSNAQEVPTRLHSHGSRSKRSSMVFK